MHELKTRTDIKLHKFKYICAFNHSGGLQSCFNLCMLAVPCVLLMYCVLIQHYFFSQIPTFCVFCAICAFFKAQRKFKLYQGKTSLTWICTCHDTFSIAYSKITKSNFCFQLQVFRWQMDFPVGTYKIILLPHLFQKIGWNITSST